jgi:hypothetical protein
LPAIVRCPECQNKFQPLAQAEPAVATAVETPRTKSCDYCGEPIALTAKKCRFCGEILDIALRTAQEARDLAGRHQPVVINNSVSSSASAAAAASAGGHRRRSLLRSFLGFIVVTVGMMFFGGMLFASGAKDAGSLVLGLGGVLLFIGVPIYLIRGVLRVLFG